MKMTSTTRNLLVLGMALGLAACGGLAAADMGSSDTSSGLPSGSFEMVCTNRGAECDWEITKCKADPACARWYSCAAACEASQSQSCFDQCKAKTEPTNGSYIKECLIKGCSAGGKELSDGAGGEYNGGGGQSPASDAAAPGWDGTGGLGASTGPQWPSCITCMYSGELSDGDGGVIVDCQTQCKDKCLADFTACQSACGVANETCVGECYEVGAKCKEGCGTAGAYKHVIGNNAPNEVTGEVDGCLLQTTWEGWEKCMFDAIVDQPGWVNADVRALYATSGMHQCVMTQCAAACTPKQDSYQLCSACLVDRCTDQANAYWSDPIAQDYGWCMDYCDPAKHASCDCDTVFELGRDIYEQFVICRMQNCESQCK